eukprot:IDg18345t1
MSNRAPASFTARNVHILLSRIAIMISRYDNRWYAAPCASVHAIAPACTPPPATTANAAMSAAPGSSPRGPSTRHLVRVYAYLAKHYGLSEFMLQTSAPANVGSCSQPVDTGRAHREARERAHMALRHAFPARNTRDFIYAVNNAAHLRALLLHARPSLPA